MAARPNDAALIQRARNAYAAGDLAGARDVCRQVLARHARSLPGLELLCRVAMAENAFEEAAQCAEQCVAQQPRHPDWHCLLGDVRVFEGLFDDATSAFRRAMKLRPGYERAVLGLANALERCGRREEAREVLGPHLAEGGEPPGLAVVQARLDLHDEDFDAVIARAQRHLGGRAAEGVQRAHLGFVLGQALERLGRFDEAMAAWTEANAAIAVPFDPEAWARQVDDLIQACPAELLRALPRATSSSELAVFIVGMPRSGSTLVESIVAAHPEVHGAGELDTIQKIVASISIDIGSTLPYPACLADLEQADVDALGVTLVDAMRGHQLSARRVVDKALANYCHLGLLELIAPQARILHCRRDPLDTCLSCFAQPLWPSAHPYTCNLEHLGAMYAGYERLMAHWRATLNLPVLDVHYEQLVADQEGVSREILEFCGLEWDPACLRYYDTGRVALTASYDQVNRPIYDRSVARHRHFEGHLKPLQRMLARA